MHQLRVRRHHEHEPRLDRLVWPWRWRVDRHRSWLIPAQMVALVAAVLLGTVGIVVLHTRFAVPDYETADPFSRLYVMPDGSVVELPEADTVQKTFDRD